MKLAFAHDHLFQLDQNGNLFTGGSFNNRVWERYLYHFEEITVLSRLENLNNKDNNKIFNEFDLKETKLVPVPSLSGPLKQFINRKKAEGIIQEVLLNSDALIARLPSEIGNLAIDVAKDLDKIYAVEVVACVWDALWNYGKPAGKLYAPIAKQKMKKRVLDSPYTLYVTNQFLQERYPTKGNSANISDVEIYDVYRESFDIRKARLNKKDYKIGMIGSLKNGIKGLGIALKALSILNEKNYDFEFYTLGDGDTQKWELLAKKLKINEKVKFCGVLPGGKSVLMWLDQMDLYIQPSFQEGLPRAVIEAMSRGCPVVGSNVGGIPELIDESCIHKVGDVRGLADCIERIINDTDYSMMLTKMNLDTSENYKKNILDNERKKFFNLLIEDCLNHKIS